MCPDSHKHGTTGTCYVAHKCRCDDCRKGNRDRERRRTRLKLYGRYDNGLTDSAPVIAHVAMLRAAGMGYKTIAKRAGVGNTAVRALIYGREDYLPGGGFGPRHGEIPARIAREKAEQILAVQPTLEALPRTAPVNARGTVRRLQALMAFGWSGARLADAIGVDVTNFWTMIHRYENRRGKSAYVRAETALTVERMYERLSVRVPPCRSRWELAAVERTRKRAAERGWPLPMDWEAGGNNFDGVARVRRSA